MRELRERFQTLQAELSPAYRQVAEFILGHPEECAFLTAAELGRRTGVSESTVVRFATALGFSGYPQLQGLIRQEILSQISTVARMERAVRQVPKAGRGHILDRVLETDLQNLARTFQNLPREDFDRAVELIAGARRVWVVGLRTSASLAILMSTALRYIGRETVLIDLGFGDFWERLDSIAAEDVALAISVPRYTRWTLEILEHAHRRGAATVAITDSVLSPLTPHADVLLPAATDLDAFFESFTAPMSLLNALLLAVALKDEQRSLQALREREARWREQHLYLQPSSQRPAGALGPLERGEGHRDGQQGAGPATEGRDA